MFHIKLLIVITMETVVGVMWRRFRVLFLILYPVVLFESLTRVCYFYN